jgi:hypothetical protein
MGRHARHNHLDGWIEFFDSTIGERQRFDLEPGSTPEGLRLVGAGRYLVWRTRSGRSFLERRDLIAKTADRMELPPGLPVDCGDVLWIAPPIGDDGRVARIHLDAPELASHRMPWASLIESGPLPDGRAWFADSWQMSICDVSTGEILRKWPLDHEVGTQIACSADAATLLVLRKPDPALDLFEVVAHELMSGEVRWRVGDVPSCGAIVWSHGKGSIHLRPDSVWGSNCRSLPLLNLASGNRRDVRIPATIEDRWYAIVGSSGRHMVLSGLPSDETVTSFPGVLSPNRDRFLFVVDLEHGRRIGTLARNGTIALGEDESFLLGFDEQGRLCQTGLPTR